jgi:cell division septation protein DedD
MSEANTFYVVPKGAEPLPIAPVDPKQVLVWATETDITSGAGASKRGGKWRVNLGVADSENAAFEIYDAVRAAGYPAEIHPIGVKDKRQYQVRISQLPNKAEAQQLANALKGKYGVTAPSVSG